MPYYKKLVGQICYLSPCDAADAAHWTTWLNDLHVALPLGSEAHTTLSLLRMEDIRQSMAKDESHVFTIVDLKTDKPIGRSLLFNVDHVNRAAMFGIFIGTPDVWGQGYGQEATRLTLDYGFNLLNLHSVMLGVFAYNERAIHCYERVGFRVIGRRRQARIVGDRKFDTIFMDILAEEFTSPYVLQVRQQLTGEDAS